MMGVEPKRRQRLLFTEMVVLENGSRQTIGYAFHKLEAGLGIAIAKGRFSVAAGQAVRVRVGGEVRTAKVVNVVEFPEGYCIDVEWAEAAASAQAERHP
jgi:hypothetical protein